MDFWLVKHIFGAEKCTFFLIHGQSQWHKKIIKGCKHWILQRESVGVFRSVQWIHRYNIVCCTKIKNYTGYTCMKIDITDAFLSLITILPFAVVYKLGSNNSDTCTSMHYDTTSTSNFAVKRKAIENQTVPKQKFWLFPKYYFFLLRGMGRHSWKCSRFKPTQAKIIHKYNVVHNFDFICFPYK